METAVQPRVPAAALPTALMGFRKSDVLSYIDELLADNTRRQQDLEERIQSLQSALGEETDTKESLLGQTQDLTGQLTDAKAANQQLQSELSAAQDEAVEYRNRLFKSEQARTILKSEYNKLEERVTRLEQELEQAKLTAEELNRTRLTVLEKEEEISTLTADRTRLEDKICQLDGQLADTTAAVRAQEELREQTERQIEEQLRTARRKADEIVGDANRAAVDLRNDAQEAATRRETEARENAEAVTRSISALKEELAQVEARMNDAYNSLRAAAERIEAVAGQAEQAQYARPEKAEPEKAPAAPQPKPAPKQVKVVVRPAQPPQEKSLSDVVLEKLTRLLGQ